MEQVTSCTYLGSIVNGDNCILEEKEFKQRTALGNKAYYANKNIYLKANYYHITPN
ncbi:MAG: hypothetical protein LBU74_05230 [Methanobacteriaceae archaeon]|nr:hypothetical protein [Candidatus Methanorudis spinitermitis]